MTKRGSVLKGFGKAALGGAILALAFIFTMIGFHESFLPANTQPSEGCDLPILMYHGLLKEEARQGKYVVSPDRCTPPGTGGRRSAAPEGRDDHL